MKFTMDKSEAKRVLDLVSKCIPQRSTLPILQTVLITVEEDGSAKFCATNLETYVTAFTKVRMEIPGSCCIDSMLTSLISNFDDGDVKFAEGKGKVTITQKNRRHQIGCMPAEEFPVGRELAGYQKLDVQEFVRAMSVASIAASNDTSRPVLQGCCIDSKKGFVAGADGYRLAKYDAVFPGDSVIIPAKAISGFILNELKGTQEEVEAVFGQWSGIRCSKWGFVLNSIEGTFPDLSSFVSDAQSEESVLEIDINKVELARKLNICGLYLARGGIPFVRLTGKENLLYLSVHASDVGDVREVFSDYTGRCNSEFSICFNPSYLLAAIGTISSDTVHIKFVSPAKPFFVTDDKVPAMLHVIMPGSLSAQDKIADDDIIEDEGDF